jgi:putative endonuclease
VARLAEIDLIFADGNVLIFIEVKKNHSHDAAWRNLSYMQQKLIYRPATEYLADTVRSLATNMRFDVALADRQGNIRMMENAIIQ